MKLHVRHTFPFTPEQFWASFWDEDWEAQEAARTDLSSELISETTEGDVLVRRTRFDTGVPLPGPLASKMGTKTLTYDQVSRIDRAASTLEWTIDPPALKDKIDAKGRMVVRATPGGCERIIEGEINVNIPFLGGKVERGVVDGIQKSHDGQAARRLVWLESRFGDGVA